MSSDSYSESSGGSECENNLWDQGGDDGGADISGFTRELISMLDSKQSLSGVDLNDESSVRKFMDDTRRDSMVNTIIRLRKLKKSVAPLLSAAEVQTIDKKLMRCVSALNMDKNRMESLVLIAERHRVLEKVMEEELLLEQEDDEIFEMFVASQVQLIKQHK